MILEALLLISLDASSSVAFGIFFGSSWGAQALASEWVDSGLIIVLVIWFLFLFSGCCSFVALLSGVIIGQLFMLLIR